LALGFREQFPRASLGYPRLGSGSPGAMALGGCRGEKSTRRERVWMQRGAGEGRGVDASVPITKETPDSFSYRNLKGQRGIFALHVSPH
jgi:hypothetical protein